MKSAAKRRIVAILITLISLVVISYILLLFTQIPKESIPYAEKGYLDLSQHEIIGNTVNLTGEWEFYSGKLIEPEQFKKEEYFPQYVNIPSIWNDYYTNPDTSGHGIGTYRLRIKVDDLEELYGIKTMIIRMANRIFVNGELVGQDGMPAELDQGYLPYNKPYSSVFKTDSNTIEIIVHVANYHYESGGISHPIYFGYYQDILELEKKKIATDLIIVIGLLIIGGYFSGVYIIEYIINKKRDYQLMFFSLYCLCGLLFRATHGERLIYNLLPHLNFDTFYKLQMLPAIAGPVVLILYLYYMFKPLCHKYFVRVFVLFGLFIMLKTLLLPVHIDSIFVPVNSLISLMGGFYTTYVLVLAILNRYPGTIFFAISALAIMNGLIVETYDAYGISEVNMVLPISILIFILSAGFHHSLRFSKTYQQVEKLNKKVIAANKIKDEFLAKTTHEFKTPLNAVINITRSFLQGAGEKLDAEEKENLNIVIAVSKRLSSLVNDILDLSHNKYGEIKLYPSNIDIKGIIDIIINIIQFTKPDKPVEIINKVESGIPYTYADEKRVKQILYNLIDNALKYTDKGKIEIGAKKEGEYILIWVEDTGKGINHDKLSTIFEPFYQIDAENSTSSHGLGLNIVKQLVELHDGKISIESEVQIGTKVSFTLPVGRKQRVNRIIATRDNAIYIETPYYNHKKNKHTILIVDDDLAGLKTIINIMDQEGYNTIGVKNGREALDIIESHNRIDLVILDLMMPELSGYDVCRKIREKYMLTELPVLMLTAAVQQGDMVIAYESGANDFINKPFDIIKLKARVKSLITVKESTKKAIEMETAFLLNQIKPHFLYNALNTIVSFYWYESRKAGELLEQLAIYLRTKFDLKNMNTLITIEKELECVEAYLAIQKARFEEKVNYEFEFNSELEFYIPQLTLEPIVENAVRHGVLSREEGGTLRIIINEEVECINIKVIDDGQGIEESKIDEILEGTSSGVGLRNVNQRLKRLNGEGISISSYVGEGTEVSFKIKKDYGDELGIKN